VRLASASHPLPACVEPLLAAPRALDDERVLAALAARELVADFRPSSCVPGGLDEQATHVAVAELRDRARPASLARAVFGWHQADEGHELLGGTEAFEVADLGDKRERRQRVDAAQAAQPGDQLTPRSLLGTLTDRALKHLDPPVDEIEGVQICVERDLLGSVLAPLLAEPPCDR